MINDIELTLHTPQKPSRVKSPTRRHSSVVCLTAWITLELAFVESKCLQGGLALAYTLRFPLSREPGTLRISTTPMCESSPSLLEITTPTGTAPFMFCLFRRSQRAERNRVIASAVFCTVANLIHVFERGSDSGFALMNLSEDETRKDKAY